MMKNAPTGATGEAMPANSFHSILAKLRASAFNLEGFTRARLAEFISGMGFAGRRADTPEPAGQADRPSAQYPIDIYKQDADAMVEDARNLKALLSVISTAFASAAEDGDDGTVRESIGRCLQQAQDLASQVECELDLMACRLYALDQLSEAMVCLAFDKPEDQETLATMPPKVVAEARMRLAGRSAPRPHFPV